MAVVYKIMKQLNLNFVNTHNDFNLDLRSLSASSA